MRPDRFLHLTVSLILAVSIGAFTAPHLGFLSALSIGAVKEISDLLRDKHNQQEAWSDMGFNATGAILGSGLVYIL
jgi:hypothetical protein